MPSAEEIAYPNKSWEEIQDIYTEEAKFQGKHHCILCPKKIILTDLDLSSHLNSALHKRALQKYFKKHELELKKKTNKIKRIIHRRVIFKTARYQKLAHLAIHFKLLA